jgi:hypothetical protein
MSKKKAFMQSGIIYIGDPIYLSGPAEYKAVVPGNKLSGRELTPAVMVDVTPDDPYNPFRKWDAFTTEIGDEKDVSLPFYGTTGGTDGRGLALQTGRKDGSFTVERIEDENGKLKELRVIFKD